MAQPQEFKYKSSRFCIDVCVCVCVCVWNVYDVVATRQLADVYFTVDKTDAV